MTERCVLTIGNFDGVHLGHQAIIARARSLAREHDLAVRAMTFDPHPATILRPDRTPLRLSDPAHRIESLCEYGADDVVVLKPTSELLAQTPEAFVRGLVEAHHPVTIVEGRDFRFGKGREGDIQTLAALGGRFDYSVELVDPVEVGLSDFLLAPVSSSLVRWLIGRGRVMDAARALGRPFELRGPVVVGEQRGRKLGIPTANLDPAGMTGMALPGPGVYAGDAIVFAGPQAGAYPAAISIGVKPTFGKRSLAIEAHLIDFDGDLYHQPIALRFTRWLRDQQPFPGVEALTAQLHRDIAHVRELPRAVSSSTGTN